MLLWLLVVFLLWALAPFCCWFFVWSFFVWTIRKSGWGFALRLAGCWFLVLFIATVVFALYSRDLDQEVRYLQSLTEPLSYISRTRAKKNRSSTCSRSFPISLASRSFSGSVPSREILSWLKTILGIHNHLLDVFTFLTAGIQHYTLGHNCRLYPTSLIDRLAEMNHQSGVKTFEHERHVQMDTKAINNSGSRKKIVNIKCELRSSVVLRVCVYVFGFYLFE